jgi:phosphatidylserine decarboxylase
MNLLREYIRSVLDDKHADGNVWEQIFQQIRLSKLHGAPMPDIDIDELADVMNDVMGYDVHRDAFYPTEYVTFEDWFLREMTDQTLVQCIKKSFLSDVCAPVQGTVRKHVPSGEMSLKKSVVIVEDLLDLVAGSRLIQISLQKTDYHRVHSPVDGTISEIVTLEKDGLFPGSEAMVIITIQSPFGDVKMMCIGEWSVQTFSVHAEVGDDVHKMFELGHFYFGSQVIVVLPDNMDVVVNEEGKERVFPGDPVGVCAL